MQPRHQENGPNQRVVLRVHAVHGLAGVEESEGVCLDDGVEGDALGVVVGLCETEGGGARRQQFLAGAKAFLHVRMAFAHENADTAAYFGIVIDVAAGAGGVFGWRLELLGRYRRYWCTSRCRE